MVEINGRGALLCAAVDIRTGDMPAHKARIGIRVHHLDVNIAWNPIVLVDTTVHEMHSQDLFVVIEIDNATRGKRLLIIGLYLCKSFRRNTD